MKEETPVASSSDACALPRPQKMKTNSQNNPQTNQNPDQETTAEAKPEASSDRLPGEEWKQKKLKEIDAEILRLIEARANIATGRKMNARKPLLDPQDKESVLHDVRSLCDELIRPRRIAFLGPQFSFTHQAALKFFGVGPSFTPVASISSVFEEVEQNQCDFGVVPVENSTDGRVVDALEQFTRTRVQICGEVNLPIHHTLMGTCERAEIKTVFSKPQAISQCRHWLAKHLPGVALEETTSTSAAAQIVKETPFSAAIASILAAKAYGLNILAPEIEDSRFNVTRFVILGKEDASKTTRDKTMLMFELPHQAGSLADAMAIFKKNRINLTWIESFPMPRESGKYLFFVDMEGHRTQMKVRRALSALEKKNAKLAVLGSYPAWK